MPALPAPASHHCCSTGSLSAASLRTAVLTGAAAVHRSSRRPAGLAPALAAAHQPQHRYTAPATPHSSAGCPVLSGPALLRAGAGREGGLEGGGENWAGREGEDDGMAGRGQHCLPSQPASTRPSNTALSSHHQLVYFSTTTTPTASHILTPSLNYSIALIPDSRVSFHFHQKE